LIHRLQTTESTMLDAAHLAAEGAPHGTAVVAERQTRGIGRHGHSWDSQIDGLYLSIVLRLPTAQPILTMALGLAVQRAVNDLASVATDIRWPNDIMLNERKLVGIMIQTAGEALIAGIGINVNQPSFPEDIRGLATSLRMETGQEHDREQLLRRVLAEVMRCAALPKREVLHQFELNSSYVSGKHVEVDGQYRGITAGLDENGFLKIATERGIQTVFAGGVRPI
jgi:BirA family biotin operon repressor/biotin-[acetyl-CoA-carboxylase] ligase